MLSGSSIAVVIPAFNVSSRLADVIRTVPREWVDAIIVIDDGSTDETSRVARSIRDERIRVVRHEFNSGVGAAIATGYRTALELGFDVIAVMAGDGQMDPSELARVVDPVATGEFDYAKGNRLRHATVVRAMPWTRLAGNLVLSALTRFATGLSHIGDSQCGFTAIHRRVFGVLDPAAMWPRYGYPNHLLGALSCAGFRVTDVVVRPIYAGERSGVRFRDAVVTIPKILLHIAVVRWSEREHTLPSAGGFVEIR